MMYDGGDWGGGFLFFVGVLLVIALIVLVAWAALHLSRSGRGSGPRPLASDAERDTPRAVRPRRDHRAAVRGRQEGSRPGPLTGGPVECERRNVGRVNVDRLARALTVDLPTFHGRDGG